MGLKPAQEPPSAKLSRQKVPICLILTTFWDEITFGHIKQWLGADFEETHFFQRRPVFWIVMGYGGVKLAGNKIQEIISFPQVLGDYRPLQPKRALPHPITIQNMRFDR